MSILQGRRAEESAGLAREVTLLGVPRGAAIADSGWSVVRQRVRRVTAAAFCLACATSDVPGQDANGASPRERPLRFTPLATARALSERPVFVVLQDSLGFLWAGTNDGLMRFDGYEVIAYRHDPANPASLANNTVRRLLEDRQGRLWIRTESGLDRLDRGTGRFAHYAIAVGQMLIDSAGTVLVAGPAGIHRYDAERDSFDLLVPFGAGEGPFRDDPIWGFLGARNGRFWLTTEGGWLLDARAGGGGIRSRRTPWRYTVLGHQDARGRLWIGHAGGVGTYLPDEDRFDDLEHHRQIAPGGSVIAIRATSDSVVWVSGSSLSRVAVTADGVGEVRTVALPDAPLTRPIWWVIEDERGVTWAATGRGLLFHDPWSKPIDVVPVRVGATRDAAGAAVMALDAAAGGGAWVGSVGGGVRRIGGVAPDRYPGPDGAGPCGHDVWALLSASRQQWVGTSRGLCWWEPPTGRVTSFPLGRAGAADPIVFALAADSSGRIWAGTSDGLAVLDPGTGRVRKFDRLSRDRPGVVRVEGLAVGGDGRVWVGTSRSDLYRIDPSTLEGEHFAVGDRPALQGSEGFWALAEGTDGRLFVGGDRGLFLLNPATGALDWLGPAAGIAASTVYALARDDAGHIWFSSDLGVSRLTPTASGFLARTFSTPDGVSIAEFNRRSFARTPGGDFLFGGMGGLVRFRPSSLADNPMPARIVVTGLERITRTGSEPVAAHGLRQVALQDGDRGFAIAFAAVAPAEVGHLRYRYRLHGVDAEWVQAREDRRARYPALPAGDYTFEVRAALGDGSTEGILALPVSVPTPWPASLWFRSAILLTIAMILVAVVRSVSTRRLAQRVRALEIERRLQGERERISRDLHDNVGGQVATLMSGIELAQLSSASGQHDRASAYLESVAADARHTLNQLRETVWSLRTEALTVRGLAEQVDNDLRARRRYLVRPTLTVTTDDGDDCRLTSAQAMHLFRITQEAVSNAIAHADASHVSVTIRTTGHASLELTIRDDGHHPSSPGSPAGSGFGIQGMAGRARDLGATFAWGPGAEGGTIVQVAVSLDRAAKARPAD